MSNSATWRTIEIDEEIFEFLQQKARPLLDSANDVLRRVLLNDAAAPKKRRSPRTKVEAVSGGPLITSEMFVSALLMQQFGDGFAVVDRFDYLFESDNDLVYFQNYNKSDPVLWYRIKKRPREILGQTSKGLGSCSRIRQSGRHSSYLPLKSRLRRVERVGRGITSKFTSTPVITDGQS